VRRRTIIDRPSRRALGPAPDPIQLQIRWLEAIVISEMLDRALGNHDPNAEGRAARRMQGGPCGCIRKGSVKAQPAKDRYALSRRSSFASVLLSRILDDKRR
jgi:hypothetical protein